MRRQHIYATSCLVLLVVCGALAEPVKEPGSPPTRPHGGKVPERVEFGIYVFDIDGISGQDQSFQVNCYLRLQWKDERLAHNDPVDRVLPLGQVWHPRVLLANRQAGLRTHLPEEVEVAPDGTVVYRQQYVGPLSQRLRLHDFPLDTQAFSIHFILAKHEVGDIELVPQKFPPDLTGGSMAEVLSLPDWDIVSYKAEVRPLEIRGTAASPGFAFEFVAKRYIGYFIWQAAVPMVLIVMMSWVPFWVDPAKAELQFAIAGSAVLTLIAFRFTLGTMLPPLPYLTRMDLLTLSATILVFAAFLQVVVTSLLGHGKGVELARRIDRVSRVMFPITFVALIIWTLFL